MIMSKSFIFLILGIIISVMASSCYRPAPKQSFQDLKSLAGSWATYEGFSFNENWEVVNDSLMSGLGFSMNGTDTAFSELMKIYQTKGDVFLAAKTDEHEGFVDFKLEKAGKDYWEFVNPENEYPQIIRYEFHNDTLLTATISNIRGNKETAFRFTKLDGE